MARRLGLSLVLLLVLAAPAAGTQRAHAVSNDERIRILQEKIAQAQAQERPWPPRSLPSRRGSATSSPRSAGSPPSGGSRARPGSPPGEAGADHEALQPADGAAELPQGPVRARGGAALEAARRDLPERRRDDARRAHLVRERGGHDRAARLPQRRRHAGSPHLSRGEQGEGADPDRTCEDGGHEGQGGDGHADDRRPHGAGAERAGPAARQPETARLGQEPEAREARVGRGQQGRVPTRGRGVCRLRAPSSARSSRHQLRRPTTARPRRAV